MTTVAAIFTNEWVAMFADKRLTQAGMIVDNNFEKILDFKDFLIWFSGDANIANALRTLLQWKKHLPKKSIEGMTLFFAALVDWLKELSILSENTDPKFTDTLLIAYPDVIYRIDWDWFVLEIKRDDKQIWNCIIWSGSTYWKALLQYLCHMHDGYWIDEKFLHTIASEVIWHVNKIDLYTWSEFTTKHLRLWVSEQKNVH